MLKDPPIDIYIEEENLRTLILLKADKFTYSRKTFAYSYICCSCVCFVMLYCHCIALPARVLFAIKIIIILLRLDFRRNFLLCISRLEIESRKFIRKSNFNEITPYIGGLRIPPNPHPKIGVEGSGSDSTCLAFSIFVPNELHV